MNKPYAVEFRMRFLTEERTKAYKWYVDGSTAGKNRTLSQQHLSDKLLVRLVERCGA